MRERGLVVTGMNWFDCATARILQPTIWEAGAQLTAILSGQVKQF